MDYKIQKVSFCFLFLSLFLRLFVCLFIHIHPDNIPEKGLKSSGKDKEKSKEKETEQETEKEKSLFERLTGPPKDERSFLPSLSLFFSHSNMQLKQNNQKNQFKLGEAKRLKKRKSAKTGGEGQEYILQRGDLSRGEE